MAIPVRAQVKRAIFIGIAAWAGLVCAASCASRDKPHQVVHIAQPVDSSPPAPPPPPSSSLVSPAPASEDTPSEVAPEPSANRPLSRSEAYERFARLKLAPVDKAIIDDCPTRAWSKNVPKRHCTKDDQCGDGFCDRGRCAVRWTCDSDYGRPCKVSGDCYTRPCIDGRCRSCASEKECDWNRGRIASESNVRCRVDTSIPGSRGCIGPAGSSFETAVPVDSKDLSP